MTKSAPRPIAPTYDNKGNPSWSSIMSAPGIGPALINMVPDRIIPVIFVPGVMGSNLESKNDKKIKWLLDSGGTMKGWLMRDAKFRKIHLTPSNMVVFKGGLITQGTVQLDEELTRRGWGTVGAMSYGQYLVDLENALNDYSRTDIKHSLRNGLINQSLSAEKGEEALKEDEVALSYKYRFPVHACGYNWLDDNGNSALLLQSCINEVIGRYRAEKKKCDKVILVTHSMGGLVARYCSEVLGMQDKIFGIVHGVMPAIGAAALYRRIKSGTENTAGSAEGWASKEILGGNAAEMTAVLSGAPGPLQLLPNPEYGNGWLQINDGKQLFKLPKNGDPYSEIYTVRGKWWSLCDDSLINPLNTEQGTNRYAAQLEKDWQEFTKIIEKKVLTFHQNISNKYHPNSYAFYGCHSKNKAYGSVVWTGKSAMGEDALSGGRASDTLNARAVGENELKEQRTVAAPLAGNGWKKALRQTFSISLPDEPGDATVPERSGLAPKAHVKSILKVQTEHEPAFRDCQDAQRFTLRAIVKIAQEVKKTALAYPG